LFPTAIELDEEVQNTEGDDEVEPQEVPKSDKPDVELFVMSHCPYGTQMEKGIIPVVETLGDKIDFEIKFVNYAMHGGTEVYEQLRQYCIEEEQNDKYLEYLKCFLRDGDTGETCLDEVNIDKEKLKACEARVDEEFKVTELLEDEASWAGGRFPQFNTHADLNAKYGVQGSPTLVINSEVVSTSRDSASLLGVVCNAFNEQPEECTNTELSSTNPDPGFGYEVTGNAAATDAGCAV
jgi:hypothetical protein